jgi:hypothetical protein
MKYTPLQIKQICDIPQETLRHWRKVLPPLKERLGYAPCFTAGDALALSIIKEIVETLHVRVQALQSVSEDLFNVCRGINWLRLEKQHVVVLLSEMRVEVCQGSTITEHAAKGAILVINPKPHIDHLRNMLTESNSQDQYEMPFPPMALKKRHLTNLL